MASALQRALVDHGLLPVALRARGLELETTNNADTDWTRLVDAALASDLYGDVTRQACANAYTRAVDVLASVKKASIKAGAAGEAGDDGGFSDKAAASPVKKRQAAQGSRAGPSAGAAGEVRASPAAAPAQASEPINLADSDDEVQCAEPATPTRQHGHTGLQGDTGMQLGGL
jgi:hypothetical protein